MGKLYFHPINEYIFHARVFIYPLHLISWLRAKRLLLSNTPLLVDELPVLSDCSAVKFTTEKLQVKQLFAARQETGSLFEFLYIFQSGENENAQSFVNNIELPYGCPERVDGANRRREALL